MANLPGPSSIDRQSQKKCYAIYAETTRHLTGITIFTCHPKNVYSPSDAYTRVIDPVDAAPCDPPQLSWIKLVTWHDSRVGKALLPISARLVCPLSLVGPSPFYVSPAPLASIDMLLTGSHKHVQRQVIASAASHPMVNALPLLLKNISQIDGSNDEKAHPS
ncbi:hypothetical protein M404DRAFT_33795 [Pisolithus tinctorius Marx 270]|uniref:Uncharacterized protein n=1 Tax=Pisolithus tinctorius Marx 270 TaxID=870435 RepID=A0A0C3N4F5_PISTI|nr:hypothetical protein M404DRAFT_33795 [Pisolithus tinctorius Marx 270]